MRIVMLLLFFTVLVGNSAFLVNKLKFSIANAPLTLFLVSGLVLYVFSLFNLLTLGLYILIGITVVLSSFGYYFLIKCKEDRKKVITLPLIWLVILFFASWIYTRNALFHTWDEFSHWGVFYKFLMLQNHLPDNPLAIVNITYPPIIPIFQYYISKILGFQEANAYFAQTLLIFALIFALTGRQKKPNSMMIALTFLLTFFMIFVVDFYICTLYVDLITGLLFGVGVALLLRSESEYGSDYYVALLITLALVLVKPIGIYFSFLMMLVGILKFTKFQNIIHGIHTREFKVLRSLFTWKLMLLIFLPVFVAISWKIQTRDLNLVKTNLTFSDNPPGLTDIYPWNEAEYITELSELDGNLRARNLLLGAPVEKTIRIPEIIRSFSVNAPYRIKMIQASFFDKLSSQKYVSSQLTVLNILTGILMISFIYWGVLYFAGEKLNHSVIWVNGILFGGFILYCLVLLLSYSFFYFYPIESIITHSSQRYLASYLIGVFVVNLEMLSSQIMETKSTRQKRISIGILILFVVMLVNLIPINSYLHLAKDPDVARFIVHRVYKGVGDFESLGVQKIYHIWQEGEKSNGYEHYIMRYFLAPIPVNIHGWMLGAKYNENDIYTVDLTPEEWLSLLNDQGYTHVLVSIADANFWDTYGELFDTHDFSTDQSPYNAIPQLFRVQPDGLYKMSLDKDE